MAQVTARTNWTIEDAHYDAFRAFLEEASGIVLGESKQYLVASRLGPIMAQHQLPGLGELVERLKRPGSNNLRNQVVEAMTTNETQFFRDVYPFEILRSHIFPDFQKRRVLQPRIWSAACSSGQEAYSLSMCLQEFNASGAGHLEAEIIGTDISAAMVEKAAKGRYRSSAVARGLSVERRDRFMTQVDADTWEVRPEVRRRVSFRVHNLLEGFGLLGRFDLIFCRNVLIYFSQDSRADILDRMAKVLNPGGYLVVGASESLARQASQYEMVRCPQGVVYRLRGK